MRTSIDIPDELFKKAKVTAAQRGTTMRELIVSSLRDRVEGDTARSIEPAWKMYFGCMSHDKEEVRRIQSVIDGDFSHIDPEDWK